MATTADAALRREGDESGLDVEEVWAMMAVVARKHGQRRRIRREGGEAAMPTDASRRLGWRWWTRRQGGTGDNGSRGVEEAPATIVVAKEGAGDDDRCRSKEAQRLWLRLKKAWATAADAAVRRHRRRRSREGGKATAVEAAARRRGDDGCDDGCGQRRSGQ